MVCIKPVMHHIMDKQVVRAPRRHREHSVEFKRGLVARSLEPGVSVAAIAMDSGVNANLLFGWRRRHLESVARPNWRLCVRQPQCCCRCPSRPPRARFLHPASATGAVQQRQDRDRDRQCARSTARTSRRCQPALRLDGLAQPRMIGLPSGTRVWIVAGHTDMRKSFDGKRGLKALLLGRGRMITINGIVNRTEFRGGLLA